MSRKPTPRELAVKKLQEADLWWLAFERAVNAWRGQAIYYIAHKSGLERAIRLGLPPGRLRAIHKEVDYARDMLLAKWDEVHSLSRSALSCEMASRIYFEEDEERHWNE